MTKYPNPPFEADRPKAGLLPFRVFISSSPYLPPGGGSTLR